MTQINTAPEAHQTAEQEIDVDALVADAVDRADTKEEAEGLARRNVVEAVEDQFSDRVPKHLLDDVCEDLGWKAGQQAGPEYVKANLDQFK